MGLYTTALVRILNVMKQEGVQGKSLCMLGKQCLHVDPLCFEEILSRMSIHYDKNIYAKVMDDRDSYAFFRMCGISDVHAIDINSADGADIICDLNEELPDKLYGKFDYVIDGGTSEHVFNIAKAVENEAKMVKNGGVVIHIVPLAGYVDHGFYSFSPTFFEDFYCENGFEIKNLDLEFIISEKEWNYTDQGYESHAAVYSGDTRSFHNGDGYVKQLNQLIKTIYGLKECGHIYLWCIAKKISEEQIEYPIQGFYRRIYS